jgi:hypothetical protein
MCQDLMFGVVELFPVGEDSPLSGDNIGAYCQVLVVASDEEEFRRIIEKYFKRLSLGVVEIDEIKHITDISEVSAEDTLVDNIGNGCLQKHQIAFGSLNGFHSEGEA